MVEEKVFETISPLVETLGVELIEVEYKGGVLKVIVDAEGGVSADQLTQVTRLTYSVIEQQEIIRSKYNLEVSSPGVERSLKTLDHFERAIGLQITVRLLTDTPPHRLEGKLIAVVDDVISLEVTEADDLKTSKTFEIPFADISKARTVFDWRAALGQKSKPKKSKKKKRSGSGR